MDILSPVKQSERLNILPVVGDIISPQDGDIWYNSTLGLFRKRENGVTSNLDTNSGGGGGGLNTISGTEDFDFGLEGDFVINTISNASLTSINIKSFNIIPIETLNTSLDDFFLNDVKFNIENIIDNTSFNIRASAGNNASGIYEIKYIINY